MRYVQDKVYGWTNDMVEGDKFYLCGCTIFVPEGIDISDEVQEDFFNEIEPDIMNFPADIGSCIHAVVQLYLLKNKRAKKHRK
jgi:hypothetical protein